jgi:hypothetical protein
MSRLKGKWAQGITPRHFAWVLKDKLAMCERPGGYGANHRRVRRQEEIIWIREQGFAYVVSLIPSSHNLHNYDELAMPYLHRPFGPHDDAKRTLKTLFPEWRALINDGRKIVVHGEEVGDRLIGTMGAYVRWAGLVDEGPRVVAIMEQITQRQLGPVGRGLIALGSELDD